MIDFIFNYLWIVILVILAVIIVARTIRIVPQSYAFVVERIGAYNRTCNVGLHILVPLLDRIANKVSLKEQVMDHRNAISVDHIERKQDGGKATIENAQLTHPYCNTGVKN